MLRCYVAIIAVPLVGCVPSCSVTIFPIFSSGLRRCYAYQKNKEDPPIVLRSIEGCSTAILLKDAGLLPKDAGLLFLQGLRSSAATVLTQPRKMATAPSGATYSFAATLRSMQQSNKAEHSGPPIVEGAKDNSCFALEINDNYAAL